MVRSSPARGDFLMVATNRQGKTGAQGRFHDVARGECGGAVKAEGDDIDVTRDAAAQLADEGVVLVDEDGAAGTGHGEQLRAIRQLVFDLLDGGIDRGIELCDAGDFEFGTGDPIRFK